MKNCPFCGSSDTKVRTENIESVVVCENCGAQGPWWGCVPDEAVQHWDMRSPQIDSTAQEMSDRTPSPALQLAEQVGLIGVDSLQLWLKHRLTVEQRKVWADAVARSLVAKPKPTYG